MPYKLGRRPPIYDTRTLKMGAYLRATPQAPDSFDATAGLAIPAWGMLANDRLGDCTAAAAAHLQMLWKAQVGQTIAYTDDQTVEFYDRVNGGRDEGAAELFVLREWRQNGGVAGEKIEAFVSVQFANLPLVKAATYLFSGLYIGVNLPLSAQGAGTWDVVPSGGPQSAPGSWGGHAVPVVSYDPGGVDVITWGTRLKMTWAFWDEYVEEAWAVLPLTTDVPAKTAAGFDYQQLQADIQTFGPVNPA